ncbi:MAG: hypothetical protein MSL80_01695 [Helicobacter sp.]|uniref:hypothetical protein n=1 Tax=Helicobacter sp. TaxID=218 RepID=UPI003753017B|nr:hypothetical protein [Helicobacter sp.]
MTAKEVLYFVRENLRDTKQPYRFSDELLLGFLNQEQNHISHLFNLPISVHRQDITPQNSDIILPSVALKILKALCNNQPLAINTLQSLKPHDISLIFIDLQVYELSKKISGFIEIFYVPSTPNTIDSTLALSDIFLDLLTYHICKRATQIETNTNNLQRVQFYDSLIKGEEDRLAKIISSINSNKILTPYRKV